MTPSQIKRQSLKEPFTVVSMFSGCGGMDLGFLGGFVFLGEKFDKTRFNIIWANDINPTACDTYAKNIGSHIKKATLTRLWIPCLNMPM